MFKRVALFIITNLAVIFMLSIVLHLVFAYFQIDNQGITPLLIFSFIFGMGGSFISLAMSKWIAKMSTGAKVIEKASNSMESWLLETVKRQARDAGIGMPEVAVYESPDINAFATGMNKNSALVAVSSGLLNSMSRDEAEAVLGHEVSHIANGDMVTLTLLQGVLNTFVIFFSRIAAMAVNNALRNNNEQMGAFTYFIVVMVFQVIFGAIASVIVMAFSRWREYRADAGGAQLAGREKMIAALQRLKQSHESTLQGQLTAFGINSGKSSVAELFMSHPPLEKRIDALQRSQLA